ncbi:Aminomethyltransferase (glycine cleavage system T protein) [Candidatus Sumerlaea chitinivorans]|jgi:aminomethyltransferase|uniref:Aminomethyltransferase n=1 Tax=Sumerlaea chitinivorans TaxID=2250252 RepID=A0A2Z4Y2Y7_SUMC1|nr:Aminomethyltransferase (glycine cleavage system T protein) [Candidatus Sumerlaea chitinivorans]
MQKTALYDKHVELGATITEFNGWLMPLFYTSITEEHHATRRAVGLFDLCHMGRILVRGTKAFEFLNWLTPARLREARVGQVLYSFLLTDKGTPLDDITIYVGSDWFLLVVNAGNCARALEWLASHAQEYEGVEVRDLSEQIGMMAVQGPRSDAVLQAFCGEKWEPLRYYTFSGETHWDSAGSTLISATGYTGEWGYELFLPAHELVAAWDKVLAAVREQGGQPAGLGARDSLRLEAAMPLYGHELSEEITPLEAGLGKFIDWEKEFLGKQALVAQRDAGIARRLVGLEMQQRGPVPRHGYRVLARDQRSIGLITSGLHSPTLGKNIAMALVKAEETTLGNEVLVEIRGSLYPMIIVKRPFYKRSETQ